MIGDTAPSGGTMTATRVRADKSGATIGQVARTPSCWAINGPIGRNVQLPPAVQDLGLDMHFRIWLSSARVLRS
jgi:hypothetical protein